MDNVQLEILGFVAGVTNLTSSVPQLYANLCNPGFASQQSAARNCLQCAGNVLWLAYGLQMGSTSMTTFALLGALMAGTLALQTLTGGAFGRQQKRASV